jgi:hypothetical protein
MPVLKRFQTQEINHARTIWIAWELLKRNKQLVMPYRVEAKLGSKVPQAFGFMYLRSLIVAKETTRAAWKRQLGQINKLFPTAKITDSREHARKFPHFYVLTEPKVAKKRGAK